MGDFVVFTNLTDNWHLSSNTCASISTGASRILIFDNKTRYGPSNWHSLGAGNQAKRGPIFRTHIDQSYAGAVALLRWLLPGEADELMKGRWQIINVRHLLMLLNTVLASRKH